MTTTPTGVRIEATSPDGGIVDITNDVMALYDLVISSMDWGSGFLTVEDALPVVHVAKTCGFADYERTEAYVASMQRTDQVAEFLRQYPEAKATTYKWVPAKNYGVFPNTYSKVVQINQNQYKSPEHDHVYPTIGGECMWVYCEEVQP